MWGCALAKSCRRLLGVPLVRAGWGFKIFKLKFEKIAQDFHFLSLSLEQILNHSSLMMP